MKGRRLVCSADQIREIDHCISDALQCHDFIRDKLKGIFVVTFLSSALVQGPLVYAKPDWVGDPPEPEVQILKPPPYTVCPPPAKGPDVSIEPIDCTEPIPPPGFPVMPLFLDLPLESVIQGSSNAVLSNSFEQHSVQRCELFDFF